MSDQSIFTQGTTSADGAAATAPNTQSANPFADLLGSIKNERGEPKYKDVQTALEALKHSQEFIPQLKQDKEATEAKLAALAAEVERLKNIEQSVEKLTQQNSQQQQTPAAGISAEQVATMVNQTLTQREREVIQKANLTSVVSAVQQAFGADAEKTFYSKASELGMSVEEVNILAAKSPAVVLKLFGLDQKKTVQQSSSSSGSVNTAAMQPNENTYIGRNNTTITVGATTQDLMQEQQNSKKLVEELHSKGLSTYDLTDPKTYFKHFGKQ